MTYGFEGLENEIDNFYRNYQLFGKVRSDLLTNPSTNQVALIMMF